MKYLGIMPTSQVPQSYEHKQLHHTDERRGKTIEYWEVWTKDPDALPPVAEKEPNRWEIKQLDKMFRTNE